MARKTKTPWSVQQTEIFKWFAKQIQITVLTLVVRARAGTGKTTTILEAVKHAPERKILLAAFNKQIADELKAKVKDPRVNARTLHSLGNYYVWKAWGKTQIDAKRGRRLAEKTIPKGVKITKELVGAIEKLASLGKNIKPFATPEELVEIAVNFDCAPEDTGNEDAWEIEDVAHAAHKAMELATERDGTIDFDDMIYLPVRCKWIFPFYDLVVIDEAQDMNPTQLVLARGACKRRGRICVVGDDRQAIYGFRGADSAALDNLKQELNATEIGLTTTYRCPKKVVALAKKLVPDYEAADSAPEGIVDDIEADQIHEHTTPGNFVLSRTNAPLAKVCLGLLRGGQRAIIRGRDIGQTLSNIVKAIVKNSQVTTIGELAAAIELWKKNRFEFLSGQDASESAFQYVEDQAETILALAEDLATPTELLTRIKELFSDNSVHNSVVCSTVHKAKGLEADRVFILVDTLYPKFAKTDDQMAEEENIEYVALTRSKGHLTLVEGRP